MAAVNMTTITPPLAMLEEVGAGSGSGDGLLETTNTTSWYIISDLDLINGNDTDKFALPSNSSGPVPYDQRLETYLVPFLFAIIFFVGVIGESLYFVTFPLI